MRCLQQSFNDIIFHWMLTKTGFFSHIVAVPLTAERFKQLNRVNCLVLVRSWLFIIQIKCDKVRRSRQLSVLGCGVSVPFFSHFLFRELHQFHYRFLYFLAEVEIISSSRLKLNNSKYRDSRMHHFAFCANDLCYLLNSKLLEKPLQSFNSVKFHHLSAGLCLRYSQTM